MVCSLSIWVCVSVCLWTTLGHSHSSIFIDIYLNLHDLYKHIPNYMPIVFQGHRSKVKVMRSKTSIFSFSKISKKILDRFSLNKSPNTQCGLASMHIVSLSLTLKVKVTVKGQRSPDSENFSFSTVLQH